MIPLAGVFIQWNRETASAEVSFPLPVISRYATRDGDNTRKVSIPFSERLTWPSPLSGAEATKDPVNNPAA